MAWASSKLTSASTGAPNSCAVGFPPRLARRRPVMQGVGRQGNLARNIHDLAVLERNEVVNRRTFLRAIGGLLAGVSASAAAQKSERVATVGLLMTTIAPDDPLLSALRAGLKELGYVEGQNIRFEYRGAYGQLDRLPTLAKELAQLPVDVIVASPDPAVVAAHRAVTTVPIVMMMFTTDPVAAGVVESLNKPGGNVTGIYGRQSELIGKRLELLREVLPALTRVGVLYDKTGASDLAELQAAARALRLELVRIEMTTPYDLEAALNTARDARVGALTTLYSVPLYAKREAIVRLARERRLPIVGQFRQFTSAGGLLSYGPDPKLVFARSAYFIARILRGSKPCLSNKRRTSNSP